MKQLRVSPFVAIRYGLEIRGSKFSGALSGQYRRKTVCPPHEWLGEIAWRFVRRFQVLAAHGHLLEAALLKKYQFYKSKVELPNRWNAIGLLRARPDGSIAATAEAPSGSVFRAARVREDRLLILQKKRIKPTGAVLQAWILSIETEALLNELSKKQSWIRGQQGYSANYKRRSYLASRENHGTCHQQHAGA